MSAKQRAQKLFLVAIPVAVSLVVTRTARGEERLAEPKHRMHIRMEAGTDFPLGTDVRIDSELPYRLRFSVSLGYLPSEYVDAMNGLLLGFGAYNQKTANLVSSALKSSALMRLHTGWRPFPREGFYMDSGYSVIALGGGSSAGNVISAFVGKPLPPMEQSIANNASFRSKTVLHMVDAEIGWESLIADKVSIRMAIGGAFTVGSTTAIRPDFDPGVFAPQVQAYSDQAAGKLDHIFRNYVFTPVLSLSVGYKLF